MLWSALQATQLIHIDMEIATGLRAVQDTFELADTNQDTTKEQTDSDVTEKEECTENQNETKPATSHELGM